MAQRVLPQQPRHQPAGILARGGLEVQPLEVVGVAGERLDLRLRRASRQRQRALGDLRRPGHLHDRADAAEALQVAGREVEHGDAVAEGAAVGIHRDLVGLGVGERVQPALSLRLVELDAEPHRGLDDQRDIELGFLGHRHSRRGRAFASARRARNSSA